MIKWLLEIVVAINLKRKRSISFSCALRFVRRDYSTLLDIEHSIMWLEDRIERRFDDDRRSSQISDSSGKHPS